MDKEYILNSVNALCDTFNNDLFFLSNMREIIDGIEEKIEIQRKLMLTREERKNKLNSEKDTFIKTFMDTHNYYYIPESEIFIEYDGERYIQINENKIWIEIYNQINKNNNLFPWKQKVRVELVSIIKKNTIYNVQLIPETSTIQTVLQIMQSIILPNKYLSKYMLTLLGDCLLKKQNMNNIIITTNNLDKFITELEFQIHHYMKCYFKDIFKHKYYNHNYKNIRILQTKECNNNYFMWSSTLKQYTFDIIFVACHYSKRYKNADNFIHTFCNNSETVDSVLMCYNNSKTYILDKFTSTMFERNDKLGVFKTDLKYLINQYFELINIPKIVFYADVDDYFKENFEEIDENNVTIYKGITAKNSKFISSFNCFFQDTFVINKDFKTTFELDEILMIYSKKHKNKKYELDEKMLLSLIKHYYSDIEIINNKYLKYVECKIWDKNQDIHKFLNDHNKYMNDISDSILTNDKLYEEYFKWCELNKKQFIVSKNYFEENI